jgi:hypothetical protein
VHVGFDLGLTSNVTEDSNFINQPLPELIPIIHERADPQVVLEWGQRVVRPACVIARSRGSQLPVKVKKSRRTTSSHSNVHPTMSRKIHTSTPGVSIGSTPAINPNLLGPALSSKEERLAIITGLAVQTALAEDVLPTRILFRVVHPCLNWEVCCRVEYGGTRLRILGTRVSELHREVVGAGGRCGGITDNDDARTTVAAENVFVREVRAATATATCVWQARCRDPGCWIRPARRTTAEAARSSTDGVVLASSTATATEVLDGAGDVWGNPVTSCYADYWGTSGCSNGSGAATATTSAFCPSSAPGISIVIITSPLATRSSRTAGFRRAATTWPTRSAIGSGLSVIDADSIGVTTETTTARRETECFWWLPISWSVGIDLWGGVGGAQSALTHNDRLDGSGQRNRIGTRVVDTSSSTTTTIVTATTATTTDK